MVSFLHDNDAPRSICPLCLRRNSMNRVKPDHYEKLLRSCRRRQSAQTNYSQSNGFAVQGCQPHPIHPLARGTVARTPNPSTCGCIDL